MSSPAFPKETSTPKVPDFSLGILTGLEAIDAPNSYGLPQWALGVAAGFRLDQNWELRFHGDDGILGIGGLLVCPSGGSCFSPTTNWLNGDLGLFYVPSHTIDGVGLGLIAGGGVMTIDRQNVVPTTSNFYPYFGASVGYDFYVNASLTMGLEGAYLFLPTPIYSRSGLGLFTSMKHWF